MGGGIGIWGVRAGEFRPRLFIGAGFPVKLGEHGRPLLLLAGLFEEFFRPARLQAITRACPRTLRMDIEKPFNAVFWTLFVLMFLIRFWFAFRVWRTGERLGADRAAHQRMGFWARATDWLFLLLLAAVVVHLWYRGGDLRRFAFPAPDWLRWAGCALGITSLGLFAWAHAILGRFWSPHLQLRPNHRLIRVGPYARIRHPIYSAIVGWMMSLGLVAANGTPFVFAALGALHLLLKMQGEEKMMLEQFGDEYREYMKRTGRLLPVPQEVGARTNRWVIAAAIAALIVGAILSRVIEPGVRVEKVMLTANTPALRLFPATPGPHPIALLAHGTTGSKEMLLSFRRGARRRWF